MDAGGTFGALIDLNRAFSVEAQLRAIIAVYAITQRDL